MWYILASQSFLPHLPTRVNFNYDYDGTDSDGEIGLFFNAVDGENEPDSDDDIGGNIYLTMNLP